MLLDSARLEAQAERLAELLHRGEVSEAIKTATRVSDLRTARILQELPDADILEVFRRVEGAHAARYAVHLPPAMLARLFGGFAQEDESKAVALLEALPPQALSRLMARLPEPQVQRLRRMLDEDLLTTADVLARFAPDSAGSVMSTQYLAVEPEQTVAQVQSALREAPPDADGTAYLFVEQADRRLVGVVSLRELIIAPSGVRIADIMTRDVFAVRTGDDATEAARRIRSRGLKLIPVVDEDDRIAGVISMQSALDLLAQEVADDFSALAAASVDESFFTPPRRAVGKRLPWMVANVFLNLGAVAVISGSKARSFISASARCFWPRFSQAPERRPRPRRAQACSAQPVVVLAWL